MTRPLHVVSVSLGSSSRDRDVEIALGPYEARLRRVGCDGDGAVAAARLRELDADPAVDVLTLGGIDRIWRIGDRCYEVVEAERLASNVRSKPVVCGFGVKTTVELATVGRYLDEGLVGPDQEFLVLSLAERYDLARLLRDRGCSLTFGDLPLSLGIPFPLRSFAAAERLARILLPVARRMPIRFFYPQGAAQDRREPAHGSLFAGADVLAGDFLLLRRYAPDDLGGKTVLTNSTTESDREWLREAGVRLLLPTTPRFEGRAFGANVLEGLLAAVLLREGREPSSDAYVGTAERLGLRPEPEPLTP